MWVIAGLGNPGKDYEGSRHNVGFLVVAGLADGCGIRLSAGRGDFMSGSGRIEGAEVRLILPLTYMNRSGHALERVLEETGVGPERILVVCDDINLPLGQLRLRASGSDGGHNGLASVIERLGTSDFPRLRVGVGSPTGGEDLVDFVLERFAASEQTLVDEMTVRAADAVRRLLRDGMSAAMTEFNRRLDPAGDAGAQED